MNEKVLILGNGFDLDLGLNTRYSDFITSDLFKHIASNNNMALAVQNEIKINRWIDLEVFIKNYVVNNKNNLDANKTEMEFNEIKETLLLYMSKIDYSKLNMNSNAARLMRAISDDDTWRILNFNYTDFDKICYMLGVNAKCTHVHGSVKKNNIILGTEDSNDIPNQFSFVVKTASHDYVSSDISSCVRRPYMVIYGHSLGETDRHYFINSFTKRSEKGNPQNSKVRIFTFGKNSEQEIMGNIRSMSSNGLDEFRKRNDLEIFDNNFVDDEQKISEFLAKVQNDSRRNKIIRNHGGELLCEYGFCEN